MATSERESGRSEAQRETARQTVEVDHGGEGLAVASRPRDARQDFFAADEEPTEHRFEWAVDRLKQVNMEAAALVERNATSIALMRALSERIDRSNRENRRTLDQIVGGTSI